MIEIKHTCYVHDALHIFLEDGIWKIEGVDSMEALQHRLENQASLLDALLDQLFTMADEDEYMSLMDAHIAHHMRYIAQSRPSEGGKFKMKSYNRGAIFKCLKTK